MGVLDSGRRDAMENEFIADKKNLNTREIGAIGKFVDVHEKKVVDEGFRLRVEKYPGVAETVPDNWNDLTVREQRDWVFLKTKNHCLSLPDSLIRLLVGSVVSVDCVPERATVPEWLDREKFQRGQRFAMNNCAGMMLAELLSLFTIFSFGYGLKPLIATKKSSDPFTAFKRYLSTAKRVRNWYSSDVWTEGTDAHRDMETVRKMHANVRKKLNVLSFAEMNEAASIRSIWSNTRTRICKDFQESCPVPAPGQCPYMFSVDDTTKIYPLNQCEMSCTMFGFMGLVILYPDSFGIHGASDDDLDAFCHVWRGLGYLLGIEDEFNFCNGTLEEVKQRSRDFLEYWVKPNLRGITPEWEHMTRCVIEGLRFYMTGVTYEQCLLYLANVLEIPMPRVRSSITHTTWIRLHVWKLTFKWATRIPTLKALINRRVIKRFEGAFEYTDEKLEELRQRSAIAFVEGIAETIAINDGAPMLTTKWLYIPHVMFATAFVFQMLEIIIKHYTENVTRVGT